MIGILGDIRQFVLDWAWPLCALASVAALLASIIPTAYRPFLIAGSIILALASANLQGRASSSAHVRLKEAREQVDRLARQNSAKALEIERQQRIARENDEALVRLSERMMAAEADAATARAELDQLERNDGDVADYLDRDVPPALRRLLIRPTP